ncbi:MAG: Gfo/Idh/MocA family oxidoreductase [Crocinitomicaceae bacterium]|nr:Gfo/Idh/MocA family oxidoreductase [Crocinitomicaceae bacterium]
MLKIGVLGAGHLGKIHMKCIRELQDMYEFAGFFDTNVQHAKEAAEQFGTMPFYNMESLMDAVDVVDIVTPTSSHYSCASAAIRKFRHTFIEKPVTVNMDEARALIKLAKEAAVKVQVGHVERFNPAFRTAAPMILQPKFIETHRLAQFNPRGTDVSVVLDLMIHDIDIVLAVTRANVRRISASGVSVLSDTPDIANARLELDNGCVANLTASRISLKSMRKSRFFQRDAYISVDFLEKESEIVRMREVKGEPDPFSITIDLGEKGVKEILFEKPDIPAANAIRDELHAFGLSIIENKPVAVTLEEGARALDVALQVLDKLNQPVILQED